MNKFACMHVSAVHQLHPCKYRQIQAYLSCIYEWRYLDNQASPDARYFNSPYMPRGVIMWDQANAKGALEGGRQAKVKSAKNLLC